MRFEIDIPVHGDPSSIFSRTWHWEMGEDISYDGQIFSFKKPLTVDVRAFWSDEDLSVTIGVSSLLTAPCCRCLKPSDIEISSDFMYLYFLREKKLPSSDLDSPENRDPRLVQVSSWRSPLDISDQVWETFVLSLPLRVLCSSTCKGLCPTCGKPLSEGACGCTNSDSVLKVMDFYPWSEESEEQK